jgi:hypothetical protein
MLCAMGACPEHGNTLVSSGGKSWCRDPGYRRSWDHDRGGMPCTDPEHWRVTDRCGGAGLFATVMPLRLVHPSKALLVPLATSRKGLA